MQASTQEFQRIKEVVARHFNLDGDDLDLRTRSWRIMWPRQIAIWFMRESEDRRMASWHNIAAQFGEPSFAHGTARNAWECVNNARQSEAHTARLLAELKEEMGK